MATYGKFDMSSDSPVRPVYASGHRGSFAPGALDGSDSLHESSENPVQSSLPNMSRSSSAATQEDVMNFFQRLRFEPKLLPSEHKPSRQGELKRHLSVALGISPDNSPSVSSKGKLLPSQEELRRITDGLHDYSTKARERQKIFSEALSLANNFFPTKKRSRSDVFPSGRSSTLLSGDRSVPGTSIGRMGTQSYVVSSGFEHEKQKAEERTKTAIPNRRTRTSLVDVKMDVRSNAVIRQSGTADRDREMARHASTGAVQGEDRALSVGVDGWGEKQKMKKKRSGTKADMSSGVMSSKLNDGYREHKQGMQQRPVADARSRLNNASHGNRPGVANGAVDNGKGDSSSQQTGFGTRSSIPRPDQESLPFLNDRRDCSLGSEKERVNLRAVNKINFREDLNLASPNSSTKLNASARAPRSGSGVSNKLSPAVNRTTIGRDWELSQCTNNSAGPVGASNRKRTVSIRSSSPPVAQWAGQRPQKITRTARRTNIVPIVSSNDETLASDNISYSGGSETALGLTRRSQVKVKGEFLSSAAISENEESGPADIKPKDKEKQFDEMDEKAGHNYQKVSTSVLPLRNSKFSAEEGTVHRIRKQGRTGRSFASARNIMPMTVEKLGNLGTAKQLRSTKVVFDKSHSKPGGPPSRKLSDRRAYTRQTAINSPADFFDGGHEELWAAANAVINPAKDIMSPFWRQMEPFFRSISDRDIDHLKKQGNLGSTVLVSTLIRLDAVGSTVLDGFEVKEHEKGIGIASETSFELQSEQFIPGRKEQNVIPLCQRLIATLISEDANVEFCSNGKEFLDFDVSGDEFEMDGDLESESLNYQAGHTASYVDRRTTGETEYDELGSDSGNSEMNSNFSPSPNGLLPDQALVASLACSQTQYENMSLNEKLLLELQSIGIFPELVPNMSQTADEISLEVKKLEEKYKQQVSKKKGVMNRVLKSALEMKETQEKELEKNAMDKLVVMTYEKYRKCRRPNTTGGKSSSNKMAKQDALAFVNRTLERCHQFVDTGVSCFSEPLYMDMLLGGSSSHNIAEDESTKQYGISSDRFLNATVSASAASPSLTSRFGHYIDNHHNIDSYVNLSSKQTPGLEDAWSNKVKKRVLDDDIGTVDSTAFAGIRSSVSSSAKGKRSERDREGKGQTIEVLSINGNTKISRSAASNVKGERKYKVKPKQKTTQLSVSINGLCNMSEQSQPPLLSVSNSCMSKRSVMDTSKEKDEFSLGLLDDQEPIDLSQLQLPGMDVLGAPDDIGGHGDLESWLNIEDDGLQDDDFMGLEIPMDDLSDLNMMV